MKSNNVPANPSVQRACGLMETYAFKDWERVFIIL
jgi:hypothetical protein